MNPLPRFLATTLFVVLATLVVLLAAPAWRTRSAPSLAERTAPAETGATVSSASTARMVVLSQRLALGLAVLGAAVALALTISLAMRPGRAGETRAPFATARTEIDALAKLAANSAAQDVELNRERDVRRRAEEDASLKQRLLAQSLEEKIRLGHDLHDGIIQSLYAVGLALETVRGLVKSNPDEAEKRLEQTCAGLNNTIRDVRAYITGLTPENLRRAGFAHALRGFLDELGAGREAQFDIEIDEDAAALLTPDQSLEALQIAREAVSNALRHGSASRITLRMHQGDGEVGLLIQDNGRGFNDAVGRPGGHGLGNMRARAARIGASLRITSQPGSGARVMATLPVARPAIV
jgi:signal transduction histidine kinase